MSKSQGNVYEAKQSIKYHIKFLQSLKSHISGSDKVLKSRAMWATWCLHRYINDKLIEDMEKAMKEFGNKDEH